MERKNINRCLGGLRMEGQGERSLQTFLPRRKQDDRCAFKCILNTDHGFKAAAWTFCTFRYGFLPHLEWKFIVIELSVTFLSFARLYFGILGFKSEQYFDMLDFCIFNLRRPRDMFVLCIRFPQISTFLVLFSFYRTPKDRTKSVLNLNSWKTIYLKIIAMFLLSFWCSTFIFLLRRCIVSSGRKKIFWLLLF